ncbi:hypothetical protein E3U23_13900 [Erythrobacter litoralis]|uniref:DUF6456 domain-containing protein n=1 Tax=Erythrobacter litoralis TaxID=39960 RepID=UPI002436119E|nr:DUF6456 domain-containing protein [Erythrobacter litoralis]MDG6080282.1 hypothetical protein [Erythrobacter litoralis]
MKRQLVERELTKVGPKRVGGMDRRARSVTVNVGESPLTWLHSRGHIDDRQLDAGERLRLDYERAQLAPSITMSWNPVRVDGGGGGDLTPSERQVAAKDRFDGAMAEAGNGLKDVLWRVVCEGGAMSDAEKELGWPARSGKLVLKLGLDRVADFYRIR